MLSTLGYDLIIAEAQARAEPAVMPLGFELESRRTLSVFIVCIDFSAITDNWVVIQATLQNSFIVFRVCETTHRCLFFFAIPRDEWNFTSADDGFRGRRGLMRFEVVVVALRNYCLINDMHCKATATCITYIKYRCLILVGAVNTGIIWVASWSWTNAKPTHQVLNIHKVVRGNHKWGNVFLLVIRFRNIGRVHE